jgi:hypothetical protein
MDSYDSSFLFPAKLIVGLQGPKKGRMQRASVLRLIQIRLTTPRFEKGAFCCQDNPLPTRIAIQVKYTQLVFHQHAR